MRSRTRGWLILGLFFCSGATALVYEVVWSKFLSQMFGSTIYAQTVVMAAFMGGLALGNRIFGRWADRAARPIQAYGLLEIAIGVYALLFRTFDRLADGLFVGLGKHLIEHSGWLLILKGVLSVALLLGPTLLMGGTLPLLAAWLQNSYADAGRRAARFYSVNSLGAVAGAALAGFWLVQTFGMILTLQFTALTNLIVGALAVVLGRIHDAPAELNGEPANRESTAALAPATPGTLHWAGLIVAMTGAVSMGLEVLSSRSLALIFGSSLQTFAVVLIAFILGIGLGSAWIASPARSGESGASERIVVGVLCFAAVWVSILVFNIEHWVDFYWIAGNGLSRNAVGYVFHELMNTGISLVILGVPAASIGAVLPLMMRAAAGSGPFGSRVGVLLTWNTLGAVAGTLLTGFIIMPQLGLRNAFGLLALILGLVALMVSAQRRWPAGAGAAVIACAMAGSLFFLGGEGWRNVMSAGMFRVREPYDPHLMPLRKQHLKVVFYEDGPDATVSVEQVDGIVAPASLGLRINGKPDAGTAADLSTQFLLAHLPMLARPGAKDVFVLGLGSGITAGTVLDYPIEHLDIAENCKPVTRAARLFGDWNHHVLDQPRTRVWNEDARTVLKLRPNQYDVLITEPSNPWQAGIGSVFSQEFYTLAASRLKPGGVVAQWFHVYEMQDDILDLVLRTFSSVFPYVEVWDNGEGDIVMMGSQRAWATGPAVFQQGFAIDRVRADMWMIDIQSPEALLARQVASQQTGFAIAGKGPIQSDLFPILEYNAPRAFYIGSGTRLLDAYDERTRQQLLAPPEKSAALHSLATMNAQIVFSRFSTVNGELFGCLFSTSLGAGVPCVFQTPTPAPAPGSEGGNIAEASKAFAAGDLDKATQLTDLALQKNPKDPQAAYMARVVRREKELRSAGGKSVAVR